MVPKLVIVDLLAQVLLKEKSPTNITSVLDRIRDLSSPNNPNFSSSMPRATKVQVNVADEVVTHDWLRFCQLMYLHLVF